MSFQPPWRLRLAERDGISPLRKQLQRSLDEMTPGLAELREAIDADPNGEDRVLLTGEGERS